jgi:hypothetical protein
MSGHFFSMLRHALFACPLMCSAAVKTSTNGQVRYLIGVSPITSAALPATGETAFYHFVQPDLREQLNDQDGKFSAPTFAGATYGTARMLPITRLDLYAHALIDDAKTGFSDPVLPSLNVHYVNSSGHRGPALLLDALHHRAPFREGPCRSSRDKNLCRDPATG